MKPIAFTQQREARALSLVVIEAGARWPAFDVDRQRLAPDCVVISQQQSEPDPSFAQRVIGRVAALQSKGNSLRLAIVATRSSQSPKALDARSRIARSLVVASAKGPAELVLVGSAAKGTRHDLFAIAGALCDGLAGADVVVRVRQLAAGTHASSGFDERSPDSRAA